MTDTVETVEAPVAVAPAETAPVAPTVAEVPVPVDLGNGADPVVLKLSLDEHQAILDAKSLGHDIAQMLRDIPRVLKEKL